MAKKSKQTIGATAKPITVEITYIPGTAGIENADSARDVLEAFEATQSALKPILASMELQRKAATAWAVASGTEVIQCEDSYWRKVQRFSRRWIATMDQMPAPTPKGARPLKDICKGKTTKDGKSLWNFITNRVPDPDLIDVAVKKGYITQDEISAAYLEVPQAAYIQRFEGEADA